MWSRLSHKSIFINNEIHSKMAKTEEDENKTGKLKNCPSTILCNLASAVNISYNLRFLNESTIQPES